MDQQDNSSPVASSQTASEDQPLANSNIASNAVNVATSDLSVNDQSSILNLPMEILEQIATLLLTTQDASHFKITCRSANNLANTSKRLKSLNRVLQTDVTDPNSYDPDWNIFLKTRKINFYEDSASLAETGVSNEFRKFETPGLPNNTGRMLDYCEAVAATSRAARRVASTKSNFVQSIKAMSSASYERLSVKLTEMSDDDSVNRCKSILADLKACSS